MSTAARIQELVEPLLAEAGVELVDVEFAGPVLRITIDQEGGVGIDVIAQVTRAISHELDEQDPVSGAYTLEVSSPGLERPLRTATHFTRAIGRDVAIKTLPGTEGERRVTGVLTAADEDSVTVRPADGDERTLSLAEIASARTVFAWGASPKPSPSKRKKANAS